MSKHKFSVFTGPSCVKDFAARLRDLEFEGVVEGTERVYGLAEGSEPSAAAWNAQVEYERAHGRMGGFRFQAV